MIQHRRFLICDRRRIVMDGRSGNAVRNEVFALYDAYREGREIRLEPPRPFHNYIK